MLRVFLAVAALASSFCSREANERHGAARSLAREVGSARAELDPIAFRSVRKDGQLAGPITMASRTLHSVTPPVPSSIEFDLDLPPDPVLRFSTGAPSLGDEALRSSIRFEVAVDGGSGPEVVFSDVLRRRALDQWRDHEVDLARWAGKRVAIRLATRFDPERDAARAAVVAWGDPVVSDRKGAPGRPTLVLVSIDCLRADHVGVYGYSRPTTPNIDALAEEATLFENAFATASWTLPSHMSMLTGLPPSLPGATKWEKLESGLDYLPEILGRSGYRTSGVVSWVYLSQVYGFERGFDSYRVLDQPEGREIVDLAIEELRRGRGRPQFLFVHLWDPHWPYEGAPEDLERMGGRPRDISSLLDLVRSGKPPDDGKEVEEVIRLYDASIAAADRELGRLVEEMKSAGSWESSLVVVTADHGEAFRERGHWQHSQTLYDELTRVPLIVKWPGKSRPDREPAPVSLVDLFATFAATAGVEVDVGGAGALARRSLAAAPDEGRIVVSEVSWRSPSGSSIKVALRDRSRKYVATLSGPEAHELDATTVESEELYDLGKDPGERENVLDREGDALGRFRAELRSYLDAARSARSLRKGDAVELDEETLEKLRSLGYTH
jgi:arylsulfatase A-like enzyme